MKKCLLLVVFATFLSCKKDRPFVTPELKTMNEAVYTSVLVVPSDEYMVYSPVSGIVEQVLVEEGDTISRDQKLLMVRDVTAKFNAESGKLNVELAKVNLESKNNRLKDIERELSIAQAQMQNDSTLYFKQKNLWNQHVGSKNELDQRLLNYNISKNKYAMQMQVYDRTKKELEISLAQSEVQLKNLQNTQRDFTITSKINGRVYELKKEVGESVTTQEPLAEIGSANSFKLELEVDEVDISKIRLDQKVFIQLDAFEDKVFEGVLIKINPKMDPRTQSFIVEALFENGPSPLYPGLSGEANILINIKKDVLVIPSNYLNSRSEVETEKGMVKVELGLRNLNYTEIKSGIDINTKIYLPE